MLLAKVVYSKAGIYFRIFYCDERKMIQVKYGETVVTSRGNTQIFVNDFITDYVLRGIACDLNDPTYSVEAVVKALVCV